MTSMAESIYAEAAERAEICGPAPLWPGGTQ